MGAGQILIDVAGTYGGRSSRDEIRRSLKEALALVENTAPDAILSSSGLRIEVIDAGTAEETQGHPLPLD